MTKIVIVALVFFLIGGVFGFGVGSSGGADEQLSQEVQRLQAQIAQARKVLPATPAEMQSIGGTVTSVSANSFTLHVSQFNPFDDFITTRTVTTNADTKIILLKQKDPEIYREEVAAYQKSIRDETYSEEGSPSAPNSFEESAGTFSDVQKGQFVSMQTDHNIKDEENFTATEVRVQMSSVTPVAE